MESHPVDTLSVLAAAYADARAYLDATEERFLAEQSEREAAYRARVRARKAEIKARFMARWSAIPTETPEQRRRRERAERRAREAREWAAREREQARLKKAYAASVCGTLAKL